jgi:hypothetical protein
VWYGWSVWSVGSVVAAALGQHHQQQQEKEDKKTGLATVVSWFLMSMADVQQHPSTRFSWCPPLERLVRWLVSVCVLPRLHRRVLGWMGCRSSKEAIYAVPPSSRPSSSLSWWQRCQGWWKRHVASSLPQTTTSSSLPQTLPFDLRETTTTTLVATTWTPQQGTDDLASQHVFVMVDHEMSPTEWSQSEPQGEHPTPTPTPFSNATCLVETVVQNGDMCTDGVSVNLGGESQGDCESWRGPLALCSSDKTQLATTTTTAPADPVAEHDGKDEKDDGPGCEAPDVFPSWEILTLAEDDAGGALVPRCTTDASS